ncbi:hypothetical protein EGT74_24655 [Chitinophaga lutea]|uniref:Uncharacterized protein n=1 Tax=Chitinophaga lutea TaxID=2488634 RepID=A0A3N4PBG7_9BACT|nr:hypothetical protein [Chitinophaga lutea]RPE05576.1 hypothetical protein EGT74_24655 [Chitinophaga lutea]
MNPKIKLMYSHHDEDELRTLFLKSLAGKRLALEEQQFIEEAMKTPHLEKKLKDLEVIYQDCDMRRLLILRPTYARWQEVWKQVQDKQEEAMFRQYRQGIVLLAVMAALCLGCGACLAILLLT